jgi:peptidoglycan/xylan/chitin deacetylase (PgdA/CDA1 family)
MSRYNKVSTVVLSLFLGALIVDGAWTIPLLWYVALVVIFLMCSILGSIVLSAQYFVNVQSRGAASTQAVALTFDDGPLPGHTTKILDYLKVNDIKASFFCIGHRIETYPDIVKRIDAEGHLIGNHSFSHKHTFPLQSSSVITKELVATDLLVEKITGRRMKFFRPPFGVTNPMVSKAVRRRNYTVIGWSIRSFDSTIKDKHKLLQRITKSIKSGDIILLHDYSDTMLEILPQVVDEIRNRGLKIVRVDELLNMKPYA